MDRRILLEALGLLAITPMFSDSTIISIVGFASLFATRIFDIIDRRIVAKAAIKQAGEEAEKLKTHTAEQVRGLQTAIQENTELTVTGIESSRAALLEANNTNAKIAVATEAMAAIATKTNYR